ncbi:MAG: GntR family transcriptional regulator [Gemmatimonadota bacterium]|nr:GntR family transcriptional regulator [Gemmatimonadota bacterium]
MTQLKIEPVHGTLPENTYEHLRDLIIRGRIPAGGRIVEAEIALRFGISRTPVREALAWLAHEGYLVPGSTGLRTELVVAPLTTDEVQELWAMIGALEGHAASAVAGLPKARRQDLAKDLKRLNSELLEASKVRPRDLDLLFELQTAFHVRFVYEIAGRRFRNIYDRIRPHVQRYEWAYATRAEAEYEPSANEHSLIIAAIKAGDRGKARNSVESHWRRAARRTIAIIDSLSERNAPRRRERSARTGS